MRYLALALLCLCGCAGGGTAVAPIDPPDDPPPGTYELRFEGGNPASLEFGHRYVARVWRTDGAPSAVNATLSANRADLSVDAEADRITLSLPSIIAGSVTVSGKINGVEVAAMTLPVVEGPTFDMDVTTLSNGAPADNVKMRFVFDGFETGDIECNRTRTVKLPQTLTKVKIQRYDDPLLGTMLKALVNGTSIAVSDGVYIHAPLTPGAPGSTAPLTIDFQP